MGGEGKVILISLCTTCQTQGVERRDGRFTCNMHASEIITTTLYMVSHAGAAKFSSILSLYSDIKTALRTMSLHMALSMGLKGFSLQKGQFAESREIKYIKKKRYLAKSWKAISVCREHGAAWWG